MLDEIGFFARLKIFLPIRSSMTSTFCRAGRFGAGTDELDQRAAA